MKIILLIALTLDGKIGKMPDHFPAWTGSEDKKLFVAITYETRRLGDHGLQNLRHHRHAVARPEKYRNDPGQMPDFTMGQSGLDGRSPDADS